MRYGLLFSVVNRLCFDELNYEFASGSKVCVARRNIVHHEMLCSNGIVLSDKFNKMPIEFNLHSAQDHERIKKSIILCESSDVKDCRIPRYVRSAIIIIFHMSKGCTG